jgi:hypothetical protein
MACYIGRAISGGEFFHQQGGMRKNSLTLLAGSCYDETNQLGNNNQLEVKNRG